MAIFHIKKISIKIDQRNNFNNLSIINANRKEKILQWKQDVTAFSNDFESFKKTYTFHDLKEELTPTETQIFCPELCTVRTGYIIMGDLKRYGDKMARFREIVSTKEKEWSIY